MSDPKPLPPLPKSFLRSPAASLSRDTRGKPGNASAPAPLPPPTPKRRK